MATPIRIFRARRLRAITCRRVYTWGAMEHIRYSAACCQTDLSNPIDRGQMRANTDRMLSMIDSAVAGAAPSLPVRLLVFPGFPHPAPVFVTGAGLSGRPGAATCYAWRFPEATGELAANGAEVLIRVSAYMDPWGATDPMDWWTIVNRCRALENMAYVVAANQGASLKRYPPYSWPGGSQVVDFDGRMLAQP